MSTLVKLEYLSQTGWVVGHAGVALLDPQRYVDRLAAGGKFGRATELDDRLQATGQVWQPDNLPDPADLVPTGTVIPRLPEPCIECDATDHVAPFQCLLGDLL